jgi:molybdate transport system substrate-binding protein
MPEALSMVRSNVRNLAAGAAVALMVMGGMCRAAEIRVISANAMRDVLAETKAKFEADTRHRLTITVVETGDIQKRVLGGENFDVIIVPKDTASELEKAGKIAPGTAVQLIRISFGLAMPNDGLKPDVSTPEALKNTLLRAKTLLVTDPATGGISGVFFKEVLDKLGIADEMKSRLALQPGGSSPAARVVRGEADMAVQAEHEIRCTKGAMFLAFPAVLQQTVVFIGGVGSAAGDVPAAKAYLHYLTSSDTDNTYSAHCLKRG